MNKKIIVVCIAALLISGSAFASVLQLGGSATWGVPVDFDSSEPVSVSDIEFGKYSIGLDARLNVGFFQFQGEMRGSFSEDLLLKEYGYYLASSLRFDIFFLDLTAGLGMRIGVARMARPTIGNTMDRARQMPLPYSPQVSSTTGQAWALISARHHWSSRPWFLQEEPALRA